MCPCDEELRCTRRSSQEQNSPGTDFSMIAPIFETVLSSLTQVKVRGAQFMQQQALRIYSPLVTVSSHVTTHWAPSLHSYASRGNSSKFTSSVLTINAANMHLGSLQVSWRMQEYEKRLLAKDHEIKVAQANARELQKRLNQANAELADSSRMAAPEPAPSQGVLVHDLTNDR